MVVVSELADIAVVVVAVVVEIFPLCEVGSVLVVVVVAVVVVVVVVLPVEVLAVADEDIIFNSNSESFLLIMITGMVNPPPSSIICSCGSSFAVSAIMNGHVSTVCNTTKAFTPARSALFALREEIDTIKWVWIGRRECTVFSSKAYLLTYLLTYYSK